MSNIRFLKELRKESLELIRITEDRLKQHKNNVKIINGIIKELIQKTEHDSRREK